MSLTLIVRRRLEAAASMAIRVPRIFWLSYGIESQLGDSGRAYGYWSKDQILYTEYGGKRNETCTVTKSGVARCAARHPVPPRSRVVAASAKNIALR